MKNIYICLLPLLALILFSCKKDEQNRPYGGNSTEGYSVTLDFGKGDIASQIASINGSYSEVIDVSNIRSLTVYGGNALGNIADFYTFSNIINGNKFESLTLVDADTVRRIQGNMKNFSAPKAKVVQRGALSYCSRLESIYLPNAVNIDSHAFASSGVKILSLPSAVYVGPSAFEGCGLLKCIDMPKVDTLRDRLFYQCGLLEEVYFPSARVIGREVFYWCREMTDAVFPLVDSIGYDSFNDTKNMKKLHFGSTLKPQMYVWSYYSHFVDIYINAEEMKLVERENYWRGSQWKSINLYK